MSRSSFNRGEEEVLLHISMFEPITYQDHAEMFGIKLNAAHNRISRMWDKKLIHIVKWERNLGGGLPMPYYALGCLPDAPKPKAISHTEASRNYRQNCDKVKEKERRQKSSRTRNERIKNDPEYGEKWRAYKRDWLRKKFGYQPMELKQDKWLSEIAMQMGCTWYFGDIREVA